MLTTIGLGVIENLQGERQMETWMSTGSRLGVTLNMTTPTVAATARVVESSGWAKRRRIIHRGPTIWALKTLRPAERETAERLHDVVAALAEGDPHPTADLIRLVTHPAISFGGLDTALLVAIADTVNVDPVTLGLGVRTVRDARKKWQEVVGDRPVGEALGAYDEAHGCSLARDRREAERIAAAAESEQARVAHRDAMTLMDELLADLPEPTDRPEVLAWITRVTGRGDDIPEAVCEQARKRVVTTMAKAGFGEQAAAQVAERICPSGDTTTAEVA